MEAPGNGGKRYCTLIAMVLGFGVSLTPWIHTYLGPPCSRTLRTEKKSHCLFQDDKT